MVILLSGLEPSGAMGIGNWFVENIFAVTIIVIFACAILGAFLRTRARDKCLKDFDGFHVTVEEKQGDAAWGRLHVFSNGFELEYTSDHHDLDGHVETSYIIYANEYDGMHALYRYHDQLTPQNQKRRLRDIRRTCRPSLFRRTGRKVRNVFNTLRDAFVQSIEAFIGQAKKTGGAMQSQGDKISEMGTGVIGHLANAYDPILERFIGRRVVIQITRDGKAEEVPGVLKEYTSKFIEVVGVRLAGSAAMSLDSPESTIPDVEIKREGRRVTVRNVGSEAVDVRRVIGKDYTQEIGAVATPGAEVDFTLNQDGIRKARVILRVARDLDMLVPRTRAVVRHAGIRERVDWKTFLLGDRSQ